MSDTRDHEFPRPALTPEEAALEARLDAHARALRVEPDAGFESRIVAATGRTEHRRSVVRVMPGGVWLGRLAIAAAVVLVGVGVSVLVTPTANRPGSETTAVELASLEQELDEWFGGSAAPTPDTDAMETLRDTLETLRTLEAGLSSPWPESPDLSDLMEVL